MDTRINKLDTEMHVVRNNQVWYTALGAFLGGGAATLIVSLLVFALYAVFT